MSINVFNDSSFWEALSEAERVILPLLEASYRLQRDAGRRCDIFSFIVDLLCFVAMRTIEKD
ncbi:hypothetical protein F441_16499 [Phytophthora nicotianae CJ01A1]|uniref:Uncharacterized protein n=4 Tax=Phytophthora nicotianae TaxID=4792 RepID=W2YM45_PHYNI|nr:hypothetical protein L915_16199 [Phytophthora nicotianae]ETO66077.1 hypothetical protein F444_16672 [Phytophthora nicotianae P1976]ETP07185.1 hypothetical protein F441_16499 [Phytophthora nicotianae CJ01A1]ETP35259.1 hypothetical protein F442_16512 [Phytophthora nicotianae P10297]ETL30997.1 hypothetical protein L916_16092 [Phytophthora nicotianae]